MADIIIDRDPPGCHCTASCEFPCWQRVGLDDHPCCKQCAPLPPVDLPGLPEDDR
jgi:hypothetical protein